MCKFTVLLTSDKETIIVTHGDAVEGAPSVALDLRDRSLAEAIDAARQDIENAGTLLFLMCGGPYNPAAAAQYEPEKVAEFTVEKDGLHAQFEALVAA